MADTPPSSRPPALLSELFDGHLITPVRHALLHAAAAVGLAGQRLDDFVLAVNEMMTNVVRHARSSGALTLWCQDGALQCEIIDEGPGIPAEYLNGHPLPSPFALNGRGLWLARRLCDSVTIKTGPLGTTVQLAISLVR
jgi:anti-sigma regulatory factor (Ser/Thr protein kinase)